MGSTERSQAFCGRTIEAGLDAASAQVHALQEPGLGAEVGAEVLLVELQLADAVRVVELGVVGEVAARGAARSRGSGRPASPAEPSCPRGPPPCVSKRDRCAPPARWKNQRRDRRTSASAANTAFAPPVGPQTPRPPGGHDQERGLVALVQRDQRAHARVLADLPRRAPDLEPALAPTRPPSAPPPTPASVPPPSSRTTMPPRRTLPEPAGELGAVGRVGDAARVDQVERRVEDVRALEEERALLLEVAAGSAGSRRSAGRRPRSG